LINFSVSIRVTERERVGDEVVLFEHTVVIECAKEFEEFGLQTTRACDDIVNTSHRPCTEEKTLSELESVFRAPTAKGDGGSCAFKGLEEKYTSQKSRVKARIVRKANMQTLSVLTSTMFKKSSFRIKSPPISMTGSLVTLYLKQKIEMGQRFRT
jgi:hypothetical protein